MAKAGGFFWYDLMTSDVPAALKFYKAVVGWNDQPFPGSAIGYVVLKAGDTGIGGIMPLPNDHMPPCWQGYIKATDTDAQAKEAVAAGGKIMRGPEDIPGNVGRFCVIVDPTGAAYMLLQPNGPEQPEPAAMTPGHIGWNEYIGDDHKKAFAYYSKLYGWTKGQAIDMGEMGVYQLVAQDGVETTGMMDRPPHIPMSYWGFYFVVEGIDAASKRITDNGGTIVMGPMEVPGGQWVVNGKDPQGAHFGLVSNTK